MESSVVRILEEYLKTHDGFVKLSCLTKREIKKLADLPPELVAFFDGLAKGTDVKKKFLTLDSTTIKVLKKQGAMALCVQLPPPAEELEAFVREQGGAVLVSNIRSFASLPRRVANYLSGAKSQAALGKLLKAAVHEKLAMRGTGTKMWLRHADFEAAELLAAALKQQKKPEIKPKDACDKCIAALFNTKENEYYTAKKSLYEQGTLKVEFDKSDKITKYLFVEGAQQAAPVRIEPRVSFAQSKAPVLESVAENVAKSRPAETPKPVAKVVTKPVKADTTVREGDKQLFLQQLDRLLARNVFQVRIAALRKELSEWSKEKFDAVIVKLIDEQKIVLQEEPYGDVTQEEQDNGFYFQRLRQYFIDVSR